MATVRKNPNVARRYKSSAWESIRLEKLLLVDGMCERCKRKGKLNNAVIVHHKVYISEENYLDDSIFLNLDNLEALCQSCHNDEHFRYEV